MNMRKGVAVVKVPVGSNKWDDRWIVKTRISSAMEKGHVGNVSI
jgi:hypothetical protein